MPKGSKHKTEPSPKEVALGCGVMVLGLLLVFGIAWKARGWLMEGSSPSTIDQSRRPAAAGDRAELEYLQRLDEMYEREGRIPSDAERQRDQREAKQLGETIEWMHAVTEETRSD